MVKSKSSMTASIQGAPLVAEQDWDSWAVDSFDKQVVKLAGWLNTSGQSSPVIGDVRQLYRVAESNGADFYSATPSQILDEIDDYVPKTKKDVESMFKDVGGWQYVKGDYDGMTKAQAIEWELKRSAKARDAVRAYSRDEIAAALFLRARM